MAIKIAKNLTVPDDSVTWKIGLLGRTGTGKTNTAVVMAEQMIESGSPVAILDPQGDWWGLRSKYPIAILGGEHGDVPLESTAGSVVADFVIGQRHPILIDLFGMGEGEMVRFATDFAVRLWRSNREALHVFCDEADLFAPQRCTGGPKAKCLGAWQNIVRRGRSRGLGCTMITQRSAVLNKDLLTQADPLFVHRLTSPNDLAAVDAYLDFYGWEKPRRREVTSQIAKLKVGEAIVISPGTLEIDPRLVKVSKRQSYDSSATPKAGESRKGPKQFASVDLDALSQQMAETIERAKSDDPKELRKRIAALEKQLRSQKPQIDQSAIEREVMAAVNERDKHWERELQVVHDAATGYAGRLQQIEKLAHLNGDAEIPVKKPPAASRTRPAVNQRSPQATRRPVASRSADGEQLRPAIQRILDAIAWFESMGIDTPTRSNVAAIAGVSPRSSSFSNNVSRLSSMELLIYPAKGLLQLTADGREQSRQSDAPPSLEELHDAWRNCPALSPSHRRLLDALLANYPEAMTREDLANAVDVSPNSSSFSNNVSRLSSLGLCRYPSCGDVVATELLFPVGIT